MGIRDPHPPGVFCVRDGLLRGLGEISCKRLPLLGFTRGAAISPQVPMPTKTIFVLGIRMISGSCGWGGLKVAAGRNIGHSSAAVAALSREICSS